MTQIAPINVRIEQGSRPEPSLSGQPLKRFLSRLNHLEFHAKSEHRLPAVYKFASLLAQAVRANLRAENLNELTPGRFLEVAGCVLERLPLDEPEFQLGRMVKFHLLRSLPDSVRTAADEKDFDFWKAVSNKVSPPEPAPTVDPGLFAEEVPLAKEPSRPRKRAGPRPGFESTRFPNATDRARVVDSEVPSVVPSPAEAPWHSLAEDFVQRLRAIKEVNSTAPVEPNLLIREIWQCLTRDKNKVPASLKPHPERDNVGILIQELQRLAENLPSSDPARDGKMILTLGIDVIRGEYDRGAFDTLFHHDGFKEAALWGLTTVRDRLLEASSPS